MLPGLIKTGTKIVQFGEKRSKLRNQIFLNLSPSIATERVRDLERLKLPELSFFLPIK